jgi:hypothetical protein
MKKLKTVLTKVGHVFSAIADADKVFRQFSPEAKEAALRTFSDVLAFVAAAEAAGVEKGANFTLDAAVLASAKQLYTDAVSDIQTARQVFDALGVGLPAPKTAA